MPAAIRCWRSGGSARAAETKMAAIAVQMAKVEEEAEQGGRRPAFIGVAAEEAARHRLQHPGWCHARQIDDDGIGNVDRAGDEAADEDGGQIAVRHRLRDCSLVHGFMLPLLGPTRLLRASVPTFRPAFSRLKQ